MIISLTLFVMAVEDWFTMKVADYLQLLLLVEVLFKVGIDIPKLIISSMIFACYLIYEIKEDIQIGGADIKIFCSLQLMGFNLLLYTIFYACLIAIIYCLGTKHKKIPFVPFIWLGYMIVNI